MSKQVLVVCQEAAGLCPYPPNTFGEAHHCHLPVWHTGPHYCKHCLMEFWSESSYDEANYRAIVKAYGLTVPCGACQGTGMSWQYAEPPIITCPTCNGSGLERSPVYGQYKDVAEKVCPKNQV